MASQVSFIPLGGIGDVTKNMYVYEYGGSMLIVDCGLGFPDETMLGVDLLVPDVSYLVKEVKRGKKIVGMVITHGHEDHFGALPFLAPQLPPFPIFATPLTAAFANEKLKELGVHTHRVKTVQFPDTLTLGPFTVSLIRVTHSVPDTAHILIETPVGIFYHGSDFKFDPTPADGKQTELKKIREAGKRGVLCLLCDCLRAEKEGKTPSEMAIEERFERAMEACRGKFIVTTYSSNVSRLNQAIRVAKRKKRKVCFIGRSLQKAKDIAVKLGYIEPLDGLEVAVEDLRRLPPSELVLLVAGSQGQENSALVRIANDEEPLVRITEDDTIVFSADPIPGNEVAINELIDMLSRRGATVIYSALTDDLHVSGHAAAQDLLDMIRYTNPAFLIPIGGSYRHMVQFRRLAETVGHQKERVLLLENGQEVLFGAGKARFGKKVASKTVFVDQTGEAVENFVLRDRKQLSASGIVVVLVEVDAQTGQMVGTPDVVTRGIALRDGKRYQLLLRSAFIRVLGKRKGRVMNWLHVRSLIGNVSERIIFKEFRLRPLVLPVVIEV